MPEPQPQNVRFARYVCLCASGFWSHHNISQDTVSYCQWRLVGTRHLFQTCSAEMAPGVLRGVAAQIMAGGTLLTSCYDVAFGVGTPCFVGDRRKRRCARGSPAGMTSKQGFLYGCADTALRQPFITIIVGTEFPADKSDIRSICDRLCGIGRP